MIILYQKYLVVSARSRISFAHLRASSGPRTEGVPAFRGTRIMTLSPLKWVGQGLSYSPIFLGIQSAMLRERSVQSCKRIKRKTYSPLDDRGVILTTSNALTFFEPDEMKLAARLYTRSPLNTGWVILFYAYCWNDVTSILTDKHYLEIAISVILCRQLFSSDLKICRMEMKTTSVTSSK